jgi:hypothetical protein
MDEGSSERGHWYQALVRGALTVRAMGTACLVAASLLGAPLAHADTGWISRSVSPGSQTSSSAATSSAATLAAAVAHLKARTPSSDGTIELVAQSTAEGQWTLVNRLGEVFTSANGAELSRGLQMLTGGVATDKLAFILTDDSLFAGRAGLKDLPKSAAVFALIGEQPRPLSRLGSNGTWMLDVRAGLLVELGERAPFDETMYQLTRPIDRSGIRLMGLEPGGPKTFTSTPRFEANGTRALIDRVDPAHIAAALPALAGQTALLVGRVDGDLLFYQPATGTERSVALHDLDAAAQRADVNMFILKSQLSAQPGSRNWLWQETAVKGLDDALKSATLADFFAVIRGRQSLVIAGVPQDGDRMTLTLSPLRASNSLSAVVPAIVPSVADITGKLGALVGSITGSVTGQVEVQGLTGYVRTSVRQTELNRRIVPGVPSFLQWLYGSSLLAGLIGLSVARRWWATLWPAEARTDYSSGIGYWAARAVRTTLFALVYIPFTGYVSAGVRAVEAWQSRRSPTKA